MQCLWLALSWNAEDSLARRKVENFYGVLIVAECGSKQPLAFYVHGKMIHPSVDTWHGYGLDEPQRGAALRARLNRKRSTQSQPDCAEISHDLHPLEASDESCNPCPMAMGPRKACFVLDCRGNGN